ncbi:MAG: LUD domain-containing protein [Planctomycetales bacterium]
MTSKYALHEHHEFVDASREALQTASLQLALSRLGETLATGNRRAFDLLPGSSLLRDKARAIKEATLSHLDEHLATLEKSIQARGGHVHWAEDGEEACRIAARIARERGIRRIVKSKSMVTEEIHLNHHLEAEGLEVTETDLGEYIIQLAGERPSHIVAPVVHKTVEEVAEVMNRKLHASEPAEAKPLAQLARRTLCKRFENADMGISGANFMVAETGSIVIVSNEGNARLTTTVP